MFELSTYIEERVHEWSIYVKDAIELFAPLKAVTGRRHRCPSLSSELKDRIKGRHCIYRGVRRSRNNLAPLNNISARYHTHRRIGTTVILL